MSGTKRAAKAAQMLAVSFMSAIIVAAGCGCRQQPSIVFADIPPSSSGGIGLTGVIGGRVRGSYSGRHIVLYTFADGHWWVQPLDSSPFTEISADGSWTTRIHLGTKYAALLTKNDKLPAPFLDSLPSVSKTIEAVSTVKASGTEEVPSDAPSPGKIMRFSGFDWQVRTIPGDYGGKTNKYSPENVFLDGSGALHMLLTRNDGGWVCSELQSVRSLGYGDYRLDVEDVGHLEPAVMFSTFTLIERPTDGDHRAMDIHITRRGEPSNKNAEFIVQPSFVPANFYYLDVPSGPLALQLKWSPDRAEFSVARARVSDERIIDSWVFSTGVPKPDGAQLNINLCRYGNAPIPPTHDAEIVVKSFDFFP
jgi:hypothetical protein